MSTLSWWHRYWLCSQWDSFIHIFCFKLKSKLIDAILDKIKELKTYCSINTNKVLTVFCCLHTSLDFLFGPVLLGRCVHILRVLTPLLPGRELAALQSLIWGELKTSITPTDITHAVLSCNELFGVLIRCCASMQKWLTLNDGESLDAWSFECRK